MRIVVLCPHAPGLAPAQRLKFEQYFASWKNAGFEVDVRPFWSRRAWQILYSSGNWWSKAAMLVAGLARRCLDVRAARTADLVYLFLEALPIGPPILERYLHRAGVPIIYDIDDLVYLPHSSGYNHFMRWFRHRGKYEELTKMADQAIVCTRYLMEFAQRYNDRVTLISSTIETTTSYRPRPHRLRSTGVVIGWSGSHSTSPYLHLLDDVFRRLQREDGIEVRVIGDATFAIPDVRLTAKAWELATEVADLSEFDIGVYPLPDEEWVLGKSGLKALQYMALEIPTVAQRIGSNLEFINDGVNGYLADTEDEWIEKLRRLVHEPALRERIGREGRATVLSSYSVEANEQAYLEVIHEALSGVTSRRGERA